MILTCESIKSCQHYTIYIKVSYVENFEYTQLA